MDLTNFTDINTLRAMIATMKAAGVHEVAAGKGAARLRIRLPGGAPVAPARSPVSVPAPTFGRLRLRSPDGVLRFPHIGDRVDAGAILALVDLGGAHVAVRAPVAGILTRISADDDQLVGFDMTLFSIRPS